MKQKSGRVAKKQDLGNIWLKRELSPYRRWIFVLVFLSALGSLLSLAFAYLIRYLINSASDKDKKSLLFFVVVLLIVLFVRIGTRTAKNYFSEKYRAKISAELRQKLFCKALHTRYDLLEKYHSGDLLTRLTSDVSEVASDTVNIVPAVAGMIIQGIGAIAALFTLDPLFTGVFTLGGLAVGMTGILLRRKMKQYHRELTEADGESRSFMQESIASALTLKAYGAEERTAEKSAGLLQVYYRKRMKNNRLRTGTNGAFSLLSNLGFIFAIVWSGVRIMRGDSDFGSLFSIVLLLGELQYPLTSFSSVLPVYYARAASGERLAEIDAAPAETYANKTEPDNSPLNKIRIDNLSFGYGRGQIFSDATAEIRGGTIVCVTGESGTGKSTLFKLLLHVYTPSSGKIGLYFGKEPEIRCRDLTESDRTLFAYVPQGNFLFSGSIRENLAYFSPEKDCGRLEEKMQKALYAACAEFVFDLPEGLNTALRERGGGLSEGQLQRLAVARALLSERPVLLLDEATSALDGETEGRLLENLRNEPGKTCLIVTHRPAALNIADQILHIRAGAIDELSANSRDRKGDLHG